MAPILLLVVAPLLAVYALTAPHTVVLEDDGFFILVSDALGVAHPPGYPLHTLLGKLFTVLVPAGSIAYRVHLLSAVCGAATGGIVGGLALRLYGSRAAAVVAGLACGLAPVFWSQAIIAEVYTLNALLFFLLFALCLEFRRRRSARWLGSIGFLAGISLANHWPLMGLSAPALMLLLWPARAAVARHALRALPWFLAGLLPYAVMLWRSRASGVPAFHGELGSFGELIGFVSRQAYASIDDTATSGWRDKLAFAGFFLTESARQLAWAGVPLAIAGIIGWWRRLPALVAPALVMAFAGNGPLLVLLLGFDDTSLYRSAFRVYPLVAYGVSALWLAGGLAWLGGLLAARVPGSVPASARDSVLRGELVVALGGGVLCLALLVSGWSQNQRRHDTWGEDYARTILEELAPDAVLFVEGDVAAGTIGVLHRIEGLRPDVTLISPRGLLFPDRLFHPLRTPIDRQARLIEEFIRATDRPVYCIGTVAPSLGRTLMGLVARIEPGHDERRSEVPERFVAYLERILEAEPRDAWVRRHRKQQIANMARVLAAHCLGGAGSRERCARLEPLLDRCRQTFQGQMAVIRICLQRGRSGELGALLAWTEQAAGALDPDLSLEDRADFFHARGHLAWRAGDPETMLASWQRALEVHPVATNPALRNLLEHHSHRGDRLAYQTLRDRFWPRPPRPPYVRALEEAWRTR